MSMSILPAGEAACAAQTVGADLPATQSGSCKCFSICAGLHKLLPCKACISMGEQMLPCNEAGSRGQLLTLLLAVNCSGHHSQRLA